MVEPFFVSPFFVEVILPFVLVFTLVFAVLQKTEILGKGKRQIDVLVALAIGLITIASFITYPELFGHTFNNIKDIPVLIFYSLSIFSFVEWIYSKRLKFLYGFFILLGLATCIKLYALILMPILLYFFLRKTKRWIQNHFSPIDYEGKDTTFSTNPATRCKAQKIPLNRYENYNLSKLRVH